MPPGTPFSGRSFFGLPRRFFCVPSGCIAECFELSSVTALAVEKEYRELCQNAL